ncbi:MAG TPA: CusA/CzcA family heavy metal efflux RND transporter, partial [Gemmataceae bacterium]|nr:CusA/CzcA family heavy metal efflux RND transporter [Gemmataceae bacterium]
MLNWIIDISLRHRLGVILSVLAFGALGILALAHLDIDAFPDTTPVQVQINTTAPSLNPAEVEQQITYAIEQKISGLPRLQQVRSISKFGLSQVVVTFEDGTDIYFARQLINERLGTVALPPGIPKPTLGPVTTGLGEVLHYVVTYKGYDFSTLGEVERVRKLTELRTIHDWIIRPQLRTVRGVAEINSWGGYEKQYQARIDPSRLIKHRLTFDQVVEAIEKNNRNVGGGYLRRGSQMILVHGIGRTVDRDQVKAIQIASKDGVPIRLGDVADVEIGHEIRRGAVTAGGKGEVVHGLGFMLMGENSHVVTRDLKKKLEEIKQTLPPDVQVETVYDRTELVDYVIETARNNLFEGGLLVIAVLFAFLGNLRAAGIVALAIPLSMLCAFSGMFRFGIAASLLSLGAIDFGMVVDSSVVMVENCVRRIAKKVSGTFSGGSSAGIGLPGDSPEKVPDTFLSTIRDAAVEVRKPTLFGELIIMIVYLPILTLEGIEGKLFRPMALTVIFALAGSLVLSMTLMPVLASLLLPRRIEEREPLVMRLAKRLYAPVLGFTMKNKIAVIGVTAGVLVVAFGMIAPHLGSEFVPRLSEGALVLGVVRLAGTDLDEAIQANTQMEKAILAAFPDEVRHVWSRVGTAEVATDPMGVELTDLFISLQPRAQWKQARTQDELVLLVDRELRALPGQRYAISQPIEQRTNEMISGIRSDLGLKLFGDDLEVLKAKAVVAKERLEQIRGAADVNVEQVTGQPVLEIKIKQDEIARYGVPAKTVLDLVETLGTKPLSEVVEGQLRFPLTVRLPEDLRKSVADIASMPVVTAAGERIPLERLATLRIVEGPSTITREWGQRRIVVTCNIRGRDMGSFVAEAQRKIHADSLKLTGRYHVEWGGQFENYQRA